MWATLAVSAVLAAAPADAGALQIKNEHFTYGLFGPERKDTKVIPGDILMLAFDVDGLTIKDDGTITYTTAMELLNDKGKSEFKEDPVERTVVNALGGSHLPCWSRISIGGDVPAGEYTVRVTVADKGTKNGPSAMVERKFTVVPPTFGIIVPMLNYDKPPAAPPPAPPLAVPGQQFLFFCGVVGFDVKPGKTPQDNLQTDVTLELTILDESGKPTPVKPFTGSLKAVTPEEKAFWGTSFPLSLNRAGKFTVVVTATDKQGNKTAKVEFPLTVVDVK
ncbi:MAG TPA: hypothetical protein VMS17_10690 [Gemmataceae bacterium]|nr:hypothetical protein [Gemmataceae bacterium]